MATAAATDRDRDLTSVGQARALARRAKAAAPALAELTQQQIDAIKSGVEAGAVTQDPIGIGYKCVEAAVKALNGEELPTTIDTGFHWYDKSNIDAEDIAALLYQ